MLKKMVLSFIHHSFLFIREFKFLEGEKQGHMENKTTWDEIIVNHTMVPINEAIENNISCVRINSYVLRHNKIMTCLGPFCE